MIALLCIVLAILVLPFKSKSRLIALGGEARPCRRHVRLSRVAKKLKLQERRAVIPSRRSLAACRPLHFFEAINGALCGSADKWGETHGVGTYPGLHYGDGGQELLLRNEYLAAENRILRGQLKGRLKFSDAERAKLGEIGRRLGRKALGEVATAALPDTILAWY